MLIELEKYHDVANWMSSTEDGRIKCAYIDMTDFSNAFPDLYPKRVDDFDSQHIDAPDGVTYCRYGFPDGVDDTLCGRWIVGWDYAHDLDILTGRKKPVSNEKIISDIKKVIDNLPEI